MAIGSKSLQFASIVACVAFLAGCSASRPTPPRKIVRAYTTRELFSTSTGEKRVAPTGSLLLVVFAQYPANVIFPNAVFAPTDASIVDADNVRTYGSFTSGPGSAISGGVFVSEEAARSTDTQEIGVGFVLTESELKKRLQFALRNEDLIPIDLEIDRK